MLIRQIKKKAIASHFRNVTKDANEKPGEFWRTFTKLFLHTKGFKSINDIVCFYRRIRM